MAACYVDQAMPWPQSLVVVGGGRWARVLAGELARLAPPAVTIAIETRHNLETMRAWARERPERARVAVRSAWSAPSVPSCAVIVANAARDHVAAAERALMCRLPTLVEKPLALTAREARALAHTASAGNIPFAAAHVFLFARYLEHFGARVAARGGATALRVHWADPVVEERHGEPKRYDPGLPVYADVLPHAVSMARLVVPDGPISGGSLDAYRGGATVHVRFRIGAIQCTALLERNAQVRCRVVEADVEGGTVRLDFSREPGCISDGASAFAGDPDWDSGMRPVASMLTAFVGAAVSGDIDSRFDVAVATAACELIEHLGAPYDAATIPPVLERIAQTGSLHADVRYTLAELLQAAGPLPSDELDRRIDLLVARIRRSDDASLRDPRTVKDVAAAVSRQGM